jgi:hypothetical protein
MQKLSCKGFERGKAVCICSTTSLQKRGSALRFKCKIRPPNAPLYDLNANDSRIVKDGVRRVVKDRQLALGELLKAIREFRKFNDEPLTLRGGDYAQAVQSLNKAIDRADGLLQS